MKRGMIRPLMLMALTSSGAASGQSASRSGDLGRLSLSLQSVVASIPVQTVERQERVDRLREMVTPEQNLIPGWGFSSWTSPLIWQS